MKRSINRCLSVLLTLVMLMTASPLAGLVAFAQAIPATGISLDSDELKIAIGKAKGLTATITPSNSTDTGVVWSTSNSSVAIVSGGLVTGVKAGKATITARLESSNGSTLTDTCLVEIFCDHSVSRWDVIKEATYEADGLRKKVCTACDGELGTEVIPKKLHVTAMALAPAAVVVGGTLRLVPVILPDNAANKNVTWQSENVSIVTVDSDGVVKGISAGSAIITATSVDVGTIKASCVVTVCAHSNFEHVETLPTCTAVGEKYDYCRQCNLKLNNITEPALGHDEYVSAQAQAPTCTVAGSTEERKCSRCSVITVMSASVAATGHSYGTEKTADGLGNHYSVCANNCGVNKYEACTYGAGVVIAPTCTDDGCTAYTCTVCNGRFEGNKVSALGHDSEWRVSKEASYQESGYMINYCKRCNKTIDVKVIEKWLHVSKIRLADTVVDLNGTDTVGITFVPENAHNKEVTWSSSNPAVARVDAATGVVTGVAIGTAVITASSKDVAGVFDTCTVTVCRHDSTTHKELSATCTRIGETYDLCTYCQKKLNYVETPMLEHQLYTVSAGQEATCYTDGYTAEVACRTCSYREEGDVRIPAGHKWSSWRYSSGDKHVRTCSVCTLEERSACAYSYVVKAPTCTEKGCDMKTCTVCGNSITSNETAALGHLDINVDDKCDRCGSEIIDPSDTCECICHKTGIMSFFYKILLFFWKLFKANQTCVCGAAHY